MKNMPFGPIETNETREWTVTSTRVLKGGYETRVSLWRFETKIAAEIFIEFASKDWDSWCLSRAA